EAKRLGLSPAAFSELTFMRGETPRDFFNVISLGRRRAGMPEWAEALSVQQRWDLVAYVWTLAHPPAAMAQGEQLYRDNCPPCHGLDGAGHGPQAAASRVPAPDLQRPGSLVDQTDTQLLAAVTDGVPGTRM